jgi:hypothetical protein
MGSPELVARAGRWHLALSADSAQLLLLGTCLFALGALASCVLERRRWLHGWRLPAQGTPWLRLGLPVVAVGMLGGVWVPEVSRSGPPDWLGLAAAVLCAAAGAEACFRGVVHGLQVRTSPVQWIEGPWLLSRAALSSALAYTAATLVLSTYWIDVPAALPWPVWLPGWSVVAGAALPTGLGLAFLRERSLSLWPGVAAHALAAAGALALRLGS